MEELTVSIFPSVESKDEYECVSRSTYGDNIVEKRACFFVFLIVSGFGKHEGCYFQPWNVDIAWNR